MIELSSDFHLLIFNGNKLPSSSTSTALFSQNALLVDLFFFSQDELKWICEKNLNLGTLSILKLFREFSQFLDLAQCVSSHKRNHLALPVLPLCFASSILQLEYWWAFSTKWALRNKGQSKLQNQADLQTIYYLERNLGVLLKTWNLVWSQLSSSTSLACFTYFLKQI